MRLQFLMLALLLWGNNSHAKVLINLYNESARSSLKIAGILMTKETPLHVELKLKTKHLGCNHITIEKSLIEETRVDHLFVEHAAVVEGTVASSINSFSKFITKNEASKQTVMIDVTMGADQCIAKELRVRVL